MVSVLLRPAILRRRKTKEGKEDTKEGKWERRKNE
jgi:hypothetical protein